ncbi:MAG: GNAT family N-acetyltransferase [Planctomycetota bacterium]|jgi:GNAT superfamily N-acetyltransferase
MVHLSSADFWKEEEMTQVVDLGDEHMHFVASCTHTDGLDEEARTANAMRESWLRDSLARGLKVKVVVDSGRPVGFAHCLPIEMGTWGMSGEDLMTVPCLTLEYGRVYSQEQGSGYGRALMKAVEAEAKRARKKGVAVLAYDHHFWFMPAPFFRRLEYDEVARDGDAVIMLKAFEAVTLPIMHKLNYQPRSVAGKVVVDAFWTPMCPTSIVEIQRVREVCAEYGDKVALNEFNCGEKETLERHQTARAIFINGNLHNWGYAAPRDELKKQIDHALAGH